MFWRKNKIKIKIFWFNPLAGPELKYCGTSYRKINKQENNQKNTSFQANYNIAEKSTFST